MHATQAASRPGRALLTHRPGARRGGAGDREPAPSPPTIPGPISAATCSRTATIAEEDGTITLEAPYRAEDAAVVPLTMRIPASVAANVKSLTLVIDKNPAPVAATFTFGQAAGDGERMLSTRVRIDMYSNVRAVIETADGKLHMATKYVKAVGRLLGAGRQGHGRGAGQPRQDADQDLRGGAPTARPTRARRR